MFLKPGLGRFLTGKSVPKVVLHGNGDNLCVELAGSRSPLLEGPGRWGASISGCWGSLQREHAEWWEACPGGSGIDRLFQSDLCQAWQGKGGRGC